MYFPFHKRDTLFCRSNTWLACQNVRKCFLINGIFVVGP